MDVSGGVDGFDAIRIEHVAGLDEVRGERPGGWRLDESTLLKYGLNGAPAADGPMPSPSAVLLRLSLSLGERLNLPPLVRRAEAALHSDAAEVLADPFWHATVVTAVIKTGRARPPEH